MNKELLKDLRSFTDYHESLWPEKGRGIPQVAMRNAIDEIVKLENRITKLESLPLPNDVQDMIKEIKEFKEQARIDAIFVTSHQELIEKLTNSIPVRGEERNIEEFDPK